MDDRPRPLSARLAALAAAIEPGSRVADVGSDHGLLPIWLAASGRAAFCLATEKSEALLRRVARPPEAAPWASRLGYRAGDGLDAILPSDRIDTVVLAGLGGPGIVRALGAAGEFGSGTTSRLVLQPRSELASVRRWLAENGWRLVSERLTVDRGRFHVTLAAERGDDAEQYRHPSLSRDDLYAAGPLLVRVRSDEVVRFWSQQSDRLASIPGEERARAVRILAAISTRA
jgi:tRNA (adenine22-N1)-methyltransferase